MPIKPREMERILLQNGFIFIRQNGSHRIYYNRQTNRTVVVPFHSKELKKGTEARILKEAGIKQSE